MEKHMNETPPCKTDPRAPHGFDRNASHSADRYVCECEGWELPELTDEGLERELPAEAFGELSPVWKKNFKEEEHMNQVRTHTPEDIQAITRKWKGLTNEEIADVWKTEYFNISYELPRAIEAKLKEKNNG
jgi:hypothetical protein